MTKKQHKNTHKKPTDTEIYIETELENNLIGMIDAETIPKQMYYLGRVNQIRDTIVMMEQTNNKVYQKDLNITFRERT